MDVKKIRDPQTENSGIAFLNFGKAANTHPDIIGKIKLDNGKIMEIALFAGRTDGTLASIAKAKFFGVRMRELDGE
jgi:hypothetical protein